MEEKDIIKNLKSLRQVKPNKDWVISIKNQIAGEDPTFRERFSEVLRVLPQLPSLTFRYKPAFVTSLALLVFFGTFVTFSAAKNAAPGNLLYSVRQLSEKGKLALTPEGKKADVQIELASQKVEALAKITADPKAKNNTFVVAFQALNEDLSAASKQLKNTKAENKEVLTAKTQELIKKTQSILTNIESNSNEEMSYALSKIVEREIQDLETRSLDEAQIELLDEAKQDFNNGNFGEALEKVWQISNR